MCSPDKVRAGIERYVRDDIIPKLEGSGWKIFAVNAALGAFLPRLKTEVDVDSIYHSVRAQMEKQGKLTLSAEDMRSMSPVLGSIAGAVFPSVTFTMEDVDKLYRYMQ